MEENTSVEKKRKITIGAICAAAMTVAAVGANFAQILDWLGIKPKEAKNVPEPAQTVQTQQAEVIPPSKIETTAAQTTTANIVPVVTTKKKSTVYLDEMKVAETNDTDFDYRTFEVLESAEDSLGNQYSGHVMSIGSSWGHECYATFYLGGKYKKLSGTVALNDISEDECKASFSILCDDKSKYNTNDVSRKFVPAQFELDVSDCEWLTIRKNGQGKDKHNAAHFLLADGKLEEAE